MCFSAVILKLNYLLIRAQFCVGIVSCDIIDVLSYDFAQQKKRPSFILNYYKIF